jgi:hypothetical protein
MLGLSKTAVHSGVSLLTVPMAAQCHEQNVDSSSGGYIPPVLCCKDLVDFAASGFLVLGQDALLLKAGLTPPCSGSVAQLAARETPAR